MAYNWVDYIIFAILFFSILGGFTRGFIREVLSLLVWVMAYIVATTFALSLAQSFAGSQLGGHVPVSTFSLSLSFLALFIGTLMVGGIFNYFVSGVLVSIGLGLINRLLGGLFGLARGLLIVLICIYIVSLTSFSQDSAFQQSRLIPRFQPFIIQLEHWVAPQYETIKTKVLQTLSQVENFI